MINKKAAWLLSVLSAVSLPTVASADTYHGDWGDAPTSLTIVQSKPLQVRYCFGGDCNMHEPTGTVERMTIRFPRRGDFPGATLTFTKAGPAYEGRYRRHNSARVFNALLIKR